MPWFFARRTRELAPFRIAPRWLVTWLLGMGLLSWPTQPAAAYCRESVMSESSGPCIEQEGVPLLHWTRPCMTYVFNDQLFERLLPMRESEIRATFEQSYQTWADVDCDGRSPFLVEQAAETTPTTTAEFVYDEPNEALVIARTRSEWASLPKHDPSALAFTLLWHDTRTGEILDVDMELNLGAGTFWDCVDNGCSGAMVDLANTITHEAGHLLGLGHTDVRGATMTTTAVGDETEKRTLERDDEEGYCACDLPEFECLDTTCACEPPPIYPSKTTVTTCACRTPGAGAARNHASDWLLVLLGAGWLWRLRGRRQRKALARRLD